MGMMTNNMIGTKSAAYQAGVDGQPEPERKTKHVSYRDPISWLMVEGDIETLASMRARQLWAKGRKQFELRELRERNQAG